MSSKWTVWTLTYCWIYFLFVGRYLPLEEIFKILILKVFFKVKIDTESHEKQMYAGHILMVHFSMTYIFSANLAAGSRGMMRHILDSYSKNINSSVFFYHVMSSHIFLMTLAAIDAHCVHLLTYWELQNSDILILLFLLHLLVVTLL